MNLFVFPQSQHFLLYLNRRQHSLLKTRKDNTNLFLLGPRDGDKLEFNMTIYR